MLKVHRIAGTVLAIFIVAHLLNHMIGIIGIDSHISTMTFLRKIYRHVFFESVLLLCVLFQLVSGLKLFFRSATTLQPWQRVQRLTGLYLAFFLFVHVSAVIVGRQVFNLDTNVYFAMAGLNTDPHRWFFIPYYFLAIFSFFTHLAAIHFQKAKRNFFGLPVKTQAQAIVALGFICALWILFVMTEGFGVAKFPEIYKVIL